MALLTNPSPGNGLFSKLLISKGGTMCVVIYFVGVIWFLCLACRTFNEATYFSENALLPGLVQGEFNEDLTAKKLHTELNQVMQENPNDIPFDWLLKKFEEMKIEAYLHNFTLKYPLTRNTVFHGQNLYAVIRAPRSSSVEGLIVTAPFRTLASAHPDNSASIAIMLALAKFCRRHKYWAKDIIFLITDHEQLGTQAWLEAYHNIQLGNGILNYGNIQGRAGSLQAAINLEFHATKISHIDVKVEGLNGQLPNLDLVNLVHRLCKNEGIRHTYRNRAVKVKPIHSKNVNETDSTPTIDHQKMLLQNNPRKKDSFESQWYNYLVNLLSMVLTQASCVPNGNHGLYHRFGIEAVTLEGFEPPPNYKKQVSGLYQVGRVLEGILRSLNNLLERFHQSYFFYLLPSNDRFIPIGSYIPSVSLIGAPLLIRGLILWLKIYARIKPKSVVKSKQEALELKENGYNLTVSCSKIAFAFFMSHLFGWIVTNSGTWFAMIGHEMNLPPKISIYLGFLVFTVISLFVSKVIKFTSLELDLLHIVALLELATFLLIIAMHNFSLSLLITTVYIPRVCFMDTRSRRMRSIKHLALLLIHPFVLIHLIVFGYTFASQGLDNFIPNGFQATQHSFVYFIIDDMIYGNWFLKAMFGFLFPCWLMIWKVFLN